MPEALLLFCAASGPKEQFEWVVGGNNRLTYREVHESNKYHSSD